MPPAVEGAASFLGTGAVPKRGAVEVPAAAETTAAEAAALSACLLPPKPTVSPRGPIDSATSASAVMAAAREAGGAAVPMAPEAITVYSSDSAFTRPVRRLYRKLMQP